MRGKKQQDAIIDISTFVTKEYVKYFDLLRARTEVFPLFSKTLQLSRYSITYQTARLHSYKDAKVGSIYFQAWVRRDGNICRNTTHICIERGSPCKAECRLKIHSSYSMNRLRYIACSLLRLQDFVFSHEQDHADFKKSPHPPNRTRISQYTLKTEVLFQCIDSGTDILNQVVIFLTIMSFESQGEFLLLLKRLVQGSYSATLSYVLDQWNLKREK